jgi:hypothetical protein
MQLHSKAVGPMKPLQGPTRSRAKISAIPGRGFPTDQGIEEKMGVRKIFSSIDIILEDM